MTACYSHFQPLKQLVVPHILLDGALHRCERTSVRGGVAAQAGAGPVRVRRSRLRAPPAAPHGRAGAWCLVG